MSDLSTRCRENRSLDVSSNDLERRRIQQQVNLLQDMISENFLPMEEEQKSEPRRNLQLTLRKAEVLNARPKARLLETVDQLEARRLQRQQDLLGQADSCIPDEEIVCREEFTSKNIRSRINKSNIKSTQVVHDDEGEDFEVCGGEVSEEVACSQGARSTDVYDISTKRGPIIAYSDPALDEINNVETLKRSLTSVHLCNPSEISCIPAQPLLSVKSDSDSSAEAQHQTDLEHSRRKTEAKTQALVKREEEAEMEVLSVGALVSDDLLNVDEVLLEIGRCMNLIEAEAFV